MLPCALLVHVPFLRRTILQTRTCRFYKPDDYMSEQIGPEFEYAASKYDER